MVKQLRLNLNLPHSGRKKWRKPGMECAVCGRRKKLGRHHLHGNGRGGYTILCSRDHKGVHWLADIKLRQIVMAMLIALRLRLTRVKGGNLSD